MVVKQGLVKRLLTTGYVTPQIPDAVIVGLAYFLSGTAIIRGIDYLTEGPPANADNPAIVMIERVGPYTFWGWSFLISGLILLVGRVTGRHFVIWLGHGLAGIIYVILSIALVQGALMSMDDWRVLETAIPAALHLILCFTMRPVPKEWFDHRRSTSCPS